MKNYVVLSFAAFLLVLLSCGGAEETAEAEAAQDDEPQAEEVESRHAHLQHAEEVAVNFLEAYGAKDYSELQNYASPSIRSYYGEHNPDVDRWVTEENIGYLQDWDGEFKDARFVKEHGSGTPQKGYYLRDLEDKEILAMAVSYYQDDRDFQEPVWMITTFAGIQTLDREEYLGYAASMDELE